MMRGFSLVEVLLAMGLSTTIVLSLVAMASPYIVEFGDVLGWESRRSEMSSVLETLRSDVHQAKETVFGQGQCYALCLVNQAGTERVLYYWKGERLFRKSASATSTLSCDGGSVISYGLDKTKTAFSVGGELVGLTVATKENPAFKMTSRIFSLVKEAQSLLSTSFSCGVAEGWVFTGTADTHWQVNYDFTNGFVLEAMRSVGGSYTESATATLPVNMSRFHSPYLRFEYKSEGNIKNGDYLKVEVHQGQTWTVVFNDPQADNIEFRSVEVALTIPNWQSANEIRFVGVLTKNPALWRIRNVEVFSP